ncbi:MAG: FAD-dependent oxidoreductase [Parcubacteria group bacterium]|nr:FAD-dependent oxidoreductase [Parcubacteria group bacterium]
MQNILVLGGGFGGIRVALDLERKLRHVINHEKNWRVVLIDRNANHTFTPNLYEVASAYGVKKEPYQIKLRGSICIPYGIIFANHKIDFIQAEISKIDIENRKIITGGGEEIDFDYLVLGLGAEVNDYGIPGVSEYAYQMKTIDDGIAINEKLNQIFKEGKEGVKELPVRIIIGGGGFTGVETAAEIACCVENLRNTCKMSKGYVSISLVEAGSTILPMVSEKERDVIKKRLNFLGVQVIERKEIKEVKPDSVLMGNDLVKSDMFIWSGGIRSNRILASVKNYIDLDDKRGSILADEYLRVKQGGNPIPFIFAVGDSVFILDHKTQKPVPAMAYTAKDQGATVASNIFNSIQNKPLKKYNPWYGAWIAPVGGKFALARPGIGNFSISGRLGWVMRQFVDFRYFLSILPFFKAMRLFFKDVVLFSKND